MICIEENIVKYKMDKLKKLKFSKEIIDQLTEEQLSELLRICKRMKGDYSLELQENPHLIKEFVEEGKISIDEIVTVEEGEEYPLLIFALKNKEYDSAQYLVDVGVDINSRYDDEKPYFFSFSKKKDIQFFVGNGVDVNIGYAEFPNYIYYSVLNRSFTQKFVDVCMYLIENGLDMNVKRQKVMRKHSLLEEIMIMTPPYTSRNEERVEKMENMLVELVEFMLKNGYKVTKYDVEYSKEKGYHKITKIIDF